MPTEEFVAQLAAQAAAWNEMAAELDRRAHDWSVHAARWAGARDARQAIASDRATWVVGQSRQLVAWLRMAAAHLLTLAGTDSP